MSDKTVQKVKESIIIARSPHDVFSFWRQLENLPIFMSHLKDVEKIDDKHYHWKAKAPLGTSVEWDAEITDEQPDKFISWKSCGDSEVDNSGSVWFTEWKELGTPGSATHLEVELYYTPPFGKVGAMVASLFGENPQQQVKDDLARLKEALEKNSYSRPALVTEQTQGI